MTSTNENSSDSGTATPTKPTRAQVLTNVLSLATQFSTCVEAFNLIHPHKDSAHSQKVALVKLGIQQGRLLIFGDAVGISSPPANIARHMIPSHPGATNPDPTLPVHFSLRDPKLDEDAINAKLRGALSEIEGRPSNLTRDELMDKYGLKSPNKFNTVGHPALDTNRLEAFREKYALLQDLVKKMGVKANVKRGLSMTMSHWTVRDVDKFQAFVSTVRLEVDGLIALMGVKEQVDRGMRSDIKSMAWHPELSGPIVRQDWEKLRLIREAVAVDYPEYQEVADKALKYINEELSGSKFAPYNPPTLSVRRASEDDSSNSNIGQQLVRSPDDHFPQFSDRGKRPGLMSRLKSWGKTSKGRSMNLAQPTPDPQRSLSADIRTPSLEINPPDPVRSKSLSALPDKPKPLVPDSESQSTPLKNERRDSEAGTGASVQVENNESNENPTALANTTNS